MGEHLDKLLSLTPRTAEASTVPEPFGKPGGPGLWKVKGMELPPYIQHVAHELVKSGHDESKAIGMAVGIVKNWAHGHSGKNKVHPDVQAAATKAIADWEAKRARAHADDGKKVAASNLTMVQQPDQNVSPSPPLPPHVEAPTPAEIHALADSVQSDTHSTPLTSSAYVHLRAAGMKMEGGDHAGALQMLRAAQTDIADEHQARMQKAVPHIAAAYSNPAVPPAEQSSAHTSMMEHVDAARRMQAVGEHVASALDRIRRSQKHGLGGPPVPLRMSRVELAGAFNANLHPHAYHGQWGNTNTHQTKQQLIQQADKLDQEAAVLFARVAAFRKMHPQASIAANKLFAAAGKAGNTSAAARKAAKGVKAKVIKKKSAVHTKKAKVKHAPKVNPAVQRRAQLIVNTANQAYALKREAHALRVRASHL